MEPAAPTIIRHLAQFSVKVEERALARSSGLGTGPQLGLEAFGSTRRAGWIHVGAALKDLDIPARAAAQIEHLWVDLDKLSREPAAQSARKTGARA